MDGMRVVVARRMRLGHFVFRIRNVETLQNTFNKIKYMENEERERKKSVCRVLFIVGVHPFRFNVIRSSWHFFRYVFFLYFIGRWLEASDFLGKRWNYHATTEDVWPLSLWFGVCECNVSWILSSWPNTNVLDMCANALMYTQIVWVSM